MTRTIASLAVLAVLAACTTQGTKSLDQDARVLDTGADVYDAEFDVPDDVGGEADARSDTGTGDAGGDAAGVRDVAPDYTPVLPGVCGTQEPEATQDRLAGALICANRCRDVRDDGAARVQCIYDCMDRVELPGCRTCWAELGHRMLDHECWEPCRSGTEFGSECDLCLRGHSATIDWFGRCSGIDLRFYGRCPDPPGWDVHPALTGMESCDDDFSREDARARCRPTRSPGVGERSDACRGCWAELYPSFAECRRATDRCDDARDPDCVDCMAENGADFRSFGICSGYWL